MSAVTLPHDLYTRFKRSVQLGNVNRVKECIEQIEGMGKDGARLAAHLRIFSRQYDMVGILRVLGEID